MLSARQPPLLQRRQKVAVPAFRHIKPFHTEIALLTDPVVSAALRKDRQSRLQSCRDGELASNRDKDGNSVVMVFAQQGDIDLLESCSSITHANKHGDTALHYASAKPNNGHTIAWLIDKGLCVNALESEGRTPVWISSHKGNPENTRALIKKGADIHLADKHGTTSFMAACEHDHLDVAQMLLDSSADRSKYNFLNAKDNDGKYVWNYAIHKVSIKGVRFLVENNANPNLLDSKGRSPLFQVCKNGYLEILQCMLKHTAEVNIQDHLGKTATMHAASRGHLELIKHLVSHGADLFLKCQNGMKAIDYARKKKHREIIELITNVEATLSEACAAVGQQLQNIRIESYMNDAEESNLTISSNQKDALQEACEQNDCHMVEHLLTNEDWSDQAFIDKMVYYCAVNKLKSVLYTFRDQGVQIINSIWRFKEDIASFWYVIKALVSSDPKYMAVVALCINKIPYDYAKKQAVVELMSTGDYEGVLEFLTLSQMQDDVFRDIIIVPAMKIPLANASMFTMLHVIAMKICLNNMSEMETMTLETAELTPSTVMRDTDAKGIAAFHQLYANLVSFQLRTPDLSVFNKDIYDLLENIQKQVPQQGNQTMLDDRITVYERLEPVLFNTAGKQEEMHLTSMLDATPQSTLKTALSDIGHLNEPPNPGQKITGRKVIENYLDSGLPPHQFAAMLWNYGLKDCAEVFAMGFWKERLMEHDDDPVLARSLARVAEYPAQEQTADWIEEQLFLLCDPCKLWKVVCNCMT